MNPTLLCLLALVASAFAFPGKDFDIKEKATEICDSDEECLANIDANAETCIFAMKKGKGGPHGGSRKGGPKGPGGPGGKRGPGSSKDKDMKKQVFIDCLTENDVDETKVAELESLKKWEFKKTLKDFFETLKETDPTVSENVHCCIGQNVEPPVIGEDRELLLENVKDKLREKMDDEDEANLLNTYLAASDTCAEEFTACGFMDFKRCTTKQCIKTYSGTA